MGADIVGARQYFWGKVEPVGDFKLLPHAKPLKCNVDLGEPQLEPQLKSNIVRDPAVHLFFASPKPRSWLATPSETESMCPIFLHVLGDSVLFAQSATLGVIVCLEAIAWLQG